MTHRRNQRARTGMSVPQMLQFGHRPGQDLKHRLAARDPGPASKAVECLPIRRLVQLAQGFAGPVSEIDLIQSSGDLDIESLPGPDRPGRLDGPFQGAAVQGGQGQTRKSGGQGLGLLLAFRVQVDARTPPGNGPPDRVAESVTDEQEGGHRQSSLRGVKQHSSLVTLLIPLPRVRVQLGVSTLVWRHQNPVVGMKLVVFGLSVSSSWGNGHATLWRGLIRALAAQGHRVTFYERDVPYYAEHRDLSQLAEGELKLYSGWDAIMQQARGEIEDADVAIVTSYCPDGAVAADLLFSAAGGLRVFYDLDTPVTLGRLRRGESVPYLGPGGLAGFDLVLSYTGGAALDELKQWGARRVLPLYGSVDPLVHHRVLPVERYRADLSYLGTYAEDRQESLLRLLVEPARRLPSWRFLIGGAQYPQVFPWTDNIFFVRHLPPSEHPAFYCSSRVTLNVTRAPMAEMGHCPSGRLFEAAACGVPVLSDSWEGLNEFFQPGSEILVASSTEEAMAALETSDEELDRIARAARERVLSDHSAERRAAQLVTAIEGALTVEA